MRVVGGKKFSEFVSLVPDDDNDLWYLSNIIRVGDLVGSTVFRREERKEDMIRAKETQRKPVHIVISVEKVEFMSFTDKLKILGKVMEGTEDLINEHQSIYLAVGEIVELRSKQWDSTSRGLLTESLDRIDKKTVFVVLDDEFCLVSQNKSYGINVLARIYSGKSGKMFNSSFNEKSYFEDIVKALPATGTETVIILGPGMVRNRLKEFLSSKSASFKIETFPSDRIDEGAIYTFLETEESGKILAQSRLASEQKLLQVFLREIAKKGLAAYGVEAVRNLLERSAVETLLITEDEFRSETGVSLLNLAERFGAKAFIFSSRDEPGIVLGKFGGFCAILRYRVDF